MPTPREHLAAVSDGTYVYTVGGRFLSADKNSAAFERFDPQSGKWTKLVDMPTPRGSYGATFIDGRIVAVGGEEPTRVLDTAEMYDIAEAKWISLPPMPTARHGEVVATVGNTVYCIGGANRPTHEGACRDGRGPGLLLAPNACDSPVFESTCGADYFQVTGGPVPPALSLFVSTAVAQHGEGDSPTPDGLVGQTDPALSLGGDGELVVQVLQMLFDGCLCNEQLLSHLTNGYRLRKRVVGNQRATQNH